MLDAKVHVARDTRSFVAIFRETWFGHPDLWEHYNIHYL